MAISTDFGTAHATTGRVGSDHMCDGSTVTLGVEAGSGVGYIKKVATFPGMIISVDRTATDINFEWRFKHATNYQTFPDSAGVFTVGSGTAADIYLIEEQS